jgi:alpha-amylase
LQPWIDNLIWVHEHLAEGGTVTRYLDDKVIVLNRTGTPGLVTALNFDTWQARTVTCNTSFGPGAQLHDYTGRHDDIQTDAEGRATFTIPSNTFSGGRSYLCFSHAGRDGPNFVRGRATTQTIIGAFDLDVGPAHNSPTAVGRITVERGVPITLKMRPDRTGWRLDSELRLALADAASHPVLTLISRGEEAIGNGNALVTGPCTFVLTGSRLPEKGSAFEIEVSYTAPQTI